MANIPGKASMRYALAALGGLLLSFGFGPVNISGAAWIGPGVILFSAAGQTARRSLGLGFAAGMVCYLCSLYWLLAMPFDWHGLPLAPALGWFALSAYSSLYIGAWVWFCWRLFRGEYRAAPIWKRLLWPMACAVIWTALEFMRGRFLGGFPWNFLGTSQYRLLPVIQVASITGVFGVSFLMVWFSVALAGAVLSLIRQPSTGRVVWSEMALPLLAVACAAGAGMSRLMERADPVRQLKVAMVQPGFRQTLIWDAQEDARRFDEVIQLSQKALASKPDLLVWPESAVPDLNAEEQQRLGRFVAGKVWLLFCDDSAAETAGGEIQYFNSAVLVNPQDQIAAIYHKRRLVIFGEYIPLARWLPFLKWLAPEGPGFTPGKLIEPFSVTHPDATFSPLICFEDSFPEEAREHTKPDTDFLVNLTNDGWFGDGSEQWQQAASAVFRCVENGVPMLRCCNNGITCEIDSHGRMTVFQAEGSVYRRGVMEANIPLKTERVSTFYNLHGDWFAWGCGGITGVALVSSFRRQERKVSTETLS